MDCSIVKEFIPSYIDQELSDDVTAQIDQHIEKCEVCRKELKAQVGLHRLLSEKLEAVKAPENLRKSIVSGIARRRVLTPNWLFRKMTLEMRPLTGFAIAALLLLSVFSRDLIDLVRSDSPRETISAPMISAGGSTIVSSGTLELKDGVSATVVGRIICIGCYLRENYMANHDCTKHGHHIGFITEDGNIWSFTDNVESEKITLDKNLMGKTVQINGKLFNSAHFIDVYRLENLEN